MKLFIPNVFVLTAAALLPDNTVCSKKDECESKCCNIIFDNGNIKGIKKEDALKCSKEAGGNIDIPNSNTTKEELQEELTVVGKDQFKCLKRLGVTKSCQPKKHCAISGGIIIGIVVGVLVLCCAGHACFSTTCKKMICGRELPPGYRLLDADGDDKGHLLDADRDVKD